MGLRSIRRSGSASPLKAGAWLVTLIALSLHWGWLVLSLPQFNPASYGPLEYWSQERDGPHGIVARGGPQGIGVQVVGCPNKNKPHNLCQLDADAHAIIAPDAASPAPPTGLVRLARNDEPHDAVSVRIFNARAPPFPKA